MSRKNYQPLKQQLMNQADDTLFLICGLCDKKLNKKKQTLPQMEHK